MEEYKKLFLIIALALSTIVYYRLSRNSKKSFEYNVLWNALFLLFIIFSKLGGLIYGRQEITIQSWSQSGVLLLCGTVPIIFLAIVYFQFRGGLKENKQGIYAAIISLAIAQFIGRIGCWFDQCCYGIACSKNTLFHVWNRDLETFTLDVVMLEMVMLFCFLCIAVLLRAQKLLIAMIYMLSNGLFRWITDSLRLDYQPKGLFGDWGHGQELSVALIVMSIWTLFFIVYYHSKKHGWFKRGKADTSNPFS
tara:strand:+ start:3540 stop:4289 length:750 start_codon:yes stop_codon:yes gene_type:complete